MSEKKEPKISDIEKLIDHFKKTNREHELNEVLKRHNIKGPDEIMDVIDDSTHEFHNESIVINKIAWKNGFKNKALHPFKRFSWHFKDKWYVRFGIYWALLFSLFFMVINAPIFINRIAVQEVVLPRTIITQEIVGGATEKSAPLDPGEIVPDGSHIIIPKIGVNAPIVFPKTPDEPTMQRYLQSGVAHYPGTAKPGEVGNTFLTGHSSNFWWVRGGFNYVFLNLDKLNTGDQAIIYHGGNKYVYTVTGKRVVEPTETSVLAQIETPILTLMTCTPPGTNWMRLIVTLEQTAPKYVEPRMVDREIIIEETETLISTDPNNLGAWAKKIWDTFTGN